MKNKSIISLILILVGCFLVSSAEAQDGFQLYYKAKKQMHLKEYDQALETFKLLMVKFPESKYLDDAQFWTGYVNGKQKKYSESFRLYEDLKKNYPNSPWVDDAEIQQIDVAEKLANRGEKPYLDYLVKKLNSPDKTIKYQASMSLAKLRDDRALPGLKQMAKNGDKDMSRVARSLIKKIESKKPQPRTGSKIIKKPTLNNRDRKTKSRLVKPGRTNKSPTRSGSIKRPSKSSKPPTRSSPPSRKSSGQKSSSGKKIK
ncbi:hypothetical protein B6I21_01865 [candidate division KSB1 bacterium 4572_119]|nr:MAG: hypothetical protein B6I21_01865 [candidate division KSB1 bacterium 4572_119]